MQHLLLSRRKATPLFSRYAALLACLLWSFQATAKPTSRPSARPVAQKKAKSSKNAKSSKKAKLPPLPSSTIRFQTREGTWMNLDLSPDGKTILFHLLGDLYTVPVTGGKATRLTQGPAFDVQARFSRDGKTILFTSDRSGCDNTWLMDRDGKNPRALTKHKYMTANSPVFSPDGQYIVNRRRITDRSSIGTVELWMHHILGGKGIQLTKGGEIGDANDPAFSPDGRYLYFASRSRFRYDRNIYRGIWKIERLDLKTHKRLTLTSNAARPTPSPNGKWLAVVRRVGAKTAIVLHDLTDGSERILTDNLDKDLQENFAAGGTYPSFAWTSDSKQLIYSAKGIFWRKSLDQTPPLPIRFQADIEQKVTNALHFPQTIARKSFQSKLLRWVQLSPQGDHVFFAAVGQIWTAPWPKAQPIKALTPADQLAYAPTLSQDGKQLAYVTWDDQKRGHLWVKTKQANGEFGSPKQITRIPGQYSSPTFSHSGSKIALIKTSGAVARGLGMGSQPWIELILVDTKTGQQTHVIHLPNRGSISRSPQPQFSKDDQRLYFSRVAHNKHKRSLILVSARLDGTDEKQHLRIYGAEEMSVSPDEKWLLFRHFHQIFVVPLPTGQPKAITLGINNNQTAGTALPTLRLSKDGGSWPSWTNDLQMTWALGPNLYTLPLQEARSILEDQVQKPKSKRKPAPKATELKLQLPVAHPQGTLALTNLRLLTMGPQGIIPNGTILIKDGQILAIGPSASVKIPQGVGIIDMKGHTATPGFVDTHAHMHYNALDIHPQRVWEYYANLAYGVTTTHDPSASTELVFSQAERVRAGRTVGPRIFSTGFILYGAEIQQKAVIHSLEEAREHIRRLKALGAFSVKSYMQPARQQRQWVIRAAHDEKMLVYPEGGGHLEMNLGMILDGHTGIEHALPVVPLFRDVVQLFARSKTGYTPTLLVAYGGIAGENYFYQHQAIWDDPRMKRFFPPRILDAVGRRRSILVQDKQWHHNHVAASAKKITDAGGLVLLGAHGQLQGLGYHWEMKGLGQGGYKPIEVLRAATIHGARYIGLHKDIGSLEAGKLADILIFPKDPSKSLDHISSLAYVLKHGYLYQASDMAQLYPTKISPPRFYWHNYR
ncbi:MAG: PD40 domain-containing protein [Myxococcales bacterium]|nr:PD40 domain-containing protein [Myxococcales bacterium]